jgi:hypothetical protein
MRATIGQNFVQRRAVATRTKLLTAEEFFYLDEPNARELIDGVVRMASPPAFEHGEIALQFGALLWNHLAPCAPLA